MLSSRRTAHEANTLRGDSELRKTPRRSTMRFERRMSARVRMSCRAMRWCMSSGVMAIAATSVFVGRQTELRALHDAFADAAQDHSQLVLVEGEAGSGRRRSSSASFRSCDAARILRASGDESESHVRLAMADQLLRSAGYAARRCGQAAMSRSAWSCWSYQLRRGRRSLRRGGGRRPPDRRRVAAGVAVRRAPAAGEPSAGRAGRARHDGGDASGGWRKLAAGSSGER